MRFSCFNAKKRFWVHVRTISVRRFTRVPKFSVLEQNQEKGITLFTILKEGIFNSVLRPFEDYFSSYETGQSVGGAKTGEPWLIRKQNLTCPVREYAGYQGHIHFIDMLF